MGLRLGLASGKLPLALEAEALTDTSAQEPCCAVDVLIATPGRLMSHLQGTPGMHLDNMKMLVSITCRWHLICHYLRHRKQKSQCVVSIAGSVAVFIAHTADNVWHQAPAAFPFAQALQHSVTLKPVTSVMHPM